MTVTSRARIDPTNEWQCQTCGKQHPIKPLARDCKNSHQPQPDDEEA